MKQEIDKDGGSFKPGLQGLNNTTAEHLIALRPRINMSKPGLGRALLGTTTTTTTTVIFTGRDYYFGKFHATK